MVDIHKGYLGSYVIAEAVEGFRIFVDMDSIDRRGCIFQDGNGFLGGIAFSGFLVMPQSLHFLMAFGGENFTPLLSMESYLEFVLLLILPFGVMFNLPFLMTALAPAGQLFMQSKA